MKELRFKPTLSESDLGFDFEGNHVLAEGREEMLKREQKRFIMTDKGRKRLLSQRRQWMGSKPQ